MLGQFLEVSVQADEIIESIGFYESLGLRQLTVGEIWQHPYAVLSDGALQIGLHKYAFDSPALTFVRQNLASFAPDLRARGIRLEFAKLDPDEFNELGFLDPGDQMVTLLEARTYSPPSIDFECDSILGDFSHYRLPGRDPDTTAAFWERLDFVPEETDDALLLTGDDLNLGVSDDNRPALVFRGDVESFATQAARLGLTNARISGDGRRGTLVTPEGIALIVTAS